METYISVYTVLRVYFIFSVICSANFELPWVCVGCGRCVRVLVLMSFFFIVIITHGAGVVWGRPPIVTSNQVPLRLALGISDRFVAYRMEVPVVPVHKCATVLTNAKHHQTSNNKAKQSKTKLSVRTMERFQQFMRGMPGGMGGGGGASGNNDHHPLPDCAEKVHVSSLALLKMLKHGRAGVPMEVMGLMLGQFVDDYTINCVDVFAMPQSGTSVSVEAVDPVFQMAMLEMLKQTGRPEMVVGWYHSHPGFGCWLSSTDINTQSSFEQLNPRAVALVVDPVQSVRGKVVIDCFRLINPQLMMLGQEPRQTTSNIGHLQKPSIQALIHGLNRHYYSIVIDYRKNELEEQMLTNLGKRNWVTSLLVTPYAAHGEATQQIVSKMVTLSSQYQERIQNEMNKTSQQILVESVGKIDPKRHLEMAVNDLMGANIIQCLGTMLDTVVF